MQFPAASFLLLALAACARSQKCNADNCLRAVRASNFPTRPTSKDCIAFQTTTTTTTTTITATATAAVLPKRDIERRADPSIPTYATSACRSPAAYASACSCIGVTSAKVTKTQTATVTTTLASPTSTCTALPIYRCTDGKVCPPRACSRQPTESDCQAQCNRPEFSCVSYTYFQQECTLFNQCCPPGQTVELCKSPAPAIYGCLDGRICPPLECTGRASSQDCQRRCDAVAGCVSYTYNGQTGDCTLFSNNCCAPAETVALCRSPAPAIYGCLDGRVCPPLQCVGQSSQQTCQARCDQVAGCVSYTYNGQTGDCTLYSNNCCAPAETITLCHSPAPGIYGCTDGRVCPPLECTGQFSNRDCQNRCDRVAGCVGYTFNGQTGDCTLYSNNCCAPGDTFQICSSPAPASANPVTCTDGTRCPPLECRKQFNNTSCRQRCDAVPGCVGYTFSQTGDCSLFGKQCCR